MGQIVLPHLTVEFNHGILGQNPALLKQLAKLYCQTWKYDKYFQEYRQCPVCRAYFGETEVEVAGIKTCDGTKSGKTHSVAALVEAWNIEDVTRDILNDSLDGKNFKGFLVLTTGGKVVGFTWGRIIPLENIRQTWGEQVCTRLATFNPNPLVCYYAELGVDKDYRGHRLGNELAGILTGWMNDFHPEKLALLRTHKNALARKIYEKLGYRVFAEDTQYGTGRVMMMADCCDDLTPQNLTW